MPRSLRLEFPGAFYHVMARGNRREAIFDLPDTVAGRRRLVERLDRRAVEEEIKNCGMPVLPEKVDARCSHCGAVGIGEASQRTGRIPPRPLGCRRRLGHEMRDNPKAPERGTAAAAILAMAEHQRKRPAEAAKALNSARTAVAANWPEGGKDPWHAWLMADLLAKEAGILIEGRD